MSGLTRREPLKPLGLIPFVVPGWPNDDTFMRSVEAIAQSGCAGWEIAIPSGGWSAATGETIAVALSESRMGLAEILPIAQRLRPNIAVLYRQTIEEWGRERLLEQLAGRFDHIMLETMVGDRAAWIESCVRHGLRWIEVRTVASIDTEHAKELAASMPPDNALYLTLASVTGGTANSFDVLAAAIAAIRARCGDRIITTGFGISTSEQVERLAAIEGLDAVAIGTSLLQHISQGARQTATYYAQLHASARRTSLDALS